MLTVCIPVYNHSFISLVKVLHKQCKTANIPFEIRIADDCSQDAIVAKEAAQLKELPEVFYHKHEVNLGNDQNRNFLANEAKYPWLLFLDADTMPITDQFVSNYLKAIDNLPADAYSGGIVYGKLKNLNHILKWKHGKATEEIQSNLNEDDYLGFRGNNFLIKKEVFLQVPFIKLPQKYGYQDTVFGINLKLKGCKLKLIHNPVEHLGLMDGITFMRKTKEAIEYALYLENNHPEIAEKIKIIRFFRKLLKLNAIGFVAKLFSLFGDRLYANLISKSPSLSNFQLYKLGYLCSLHQQAKNQA